MEVIRTIIDFILHIDKHLVEIVSNYQNWTYLIIFLIIFAETGFVITPFLPGDSLLFAVGALIATGNTGLDIYIMGLLLCAAAITGNTVNYYLGGYLGFKVFKADNKVLKLEYYSKTQEFFIKHGGKAIIFSRFLPIFRTVAPFVAGVGGMPIGRYTLYNAIGGITWVILFLIAGYAFGNILFVKEHFAAVVLGIILLSVIPPIFVSLKSKFSKAKVA